MAKVVVFEWIGVLFARVMENVIVTRRVAHANGLCRASNFGIPRRIHASLLMCIQMWSTF